MKKFVIAFLAISISVCSWAQSKKELAAEVTKLKSEISELTKPKVANLDDETKKASYGLGVLIASNLKNQGGDSVNLESLYFGIQDVFKKKDLIISEQECSAIVQTYMEGANAKKTLVMKAEGEKFLAENKTKEGVKVTASGLQYKVLRTGTGKMPTAADEVMCHYVGTLIDGTEFDSSIKRGEPATFGVTQLIAGWTEALQMMHEGDKWMLYIPYDIGFGEHGSGSQIPPYAALIFELELIKVN